MCVCVCFLLWDLMGWGKGVGGYLITPPPSLSLSIKNIYTHKLFKNKTTKTPPRHRARHPGVAGQPRPHPHPLRHAHDQRHWLRPPPAVGFISCVCFVCVFLSYIYIFPPQKNRNTSHNTNTQITTKNTRRTENGMDPNRDFPYRQDPDQCMLTIAVRFFGSCVGGGEDDVFFTTLNFF